MDARERFSISSFCKHSSFTEHAGENVGGGTDVVSLEQSQMVRVFGLQSTDQKIELRKAA